METVQTFGGVPIKCWISPNEFTAIDGEGKQSLLKQSKNISELHHAFHHVALMPDAHSGFGMPIGGVLALKDAICPGAVGYDMGCGMNAVKTNISAEELEDVRVKLCAAVQKGIPTGKGGERLASKETISKLDNIDISIRVQTAYVNDRAKKTYYGQVGTLGGGNHFIEFDKDSEGNVWIVIHSGSRGFGHAVAGYYMELAQESCRKWGVKVDPQLAYFPMDTQEGFDYYRAMNIALEWAMENRELMMDDVIDYTEHFVGRRVEVLEHINVHHNYASFEEHFGERVLVHRKGATRAMLDEMLVIPGNMGDGTAICRGLGNRDSFSTSSHGAGRAMGRGEAKRKLNRKEQEKYLLDKNVYLSAGPDGGLDEMPAAYKPFQEVLDRQKDLVEVTERLYPIAVVKG